MEMLTLIGGLCFVSFIKPIAVAELEYICWTHLKTEIESSLRNVLFTYSCNIDFAGLHVFTMLIRVYYIFFIIRHVVKIISSVTVFMRLM
jgi:hypothetical protein